MLDNLLKFFFSEKTSAKPTSTSRKNLNPVKVTIYSNSELSHPSQDAKLDIQNRSNPLRN
jgi:hypothetical protein